MLGCATPPPALTATPRTPPPLPPLPPPPRRLLFHGAAPSLASRAPPPPDVPALPPPPALGGPAVACARGEALDRDRTKAPGARARVTGCPYDRDSTLVEHTLAAAVHRGIVARAHQPERRFALTRAHEQVRQRLRKPHTVARRSSGASEPLQRGAFNNRLRCEGCTARVYDVSVERGNCEIGARRHHSPRSAGLACAMDAKSACSVRVLGCGPYLHC
jgi:hypothetical protein